MSTLLPSKQKLFVLQGAILEIRFFMGKFVKPSQPFRGGCHKYKYRRVIHDLSKLVKLQDYAKANHLSVSGVMSRLKTGKLLGYKLGGCWWIVPPTLRAYIDP